MLVACFCITSAKNKTKLKLVTIGNIAVLIPESGTFNKSSQIDTKLLETFSKFNTYIAHDDDFNFFVVYKQFSLKSGKIDEILAKKMVDVINGDLLDNMRGKISVLMKAAEGKFTRFSGTITTDKRKHFYQIVSRLNNGELETISCLSKIEDVSLNDKVILNLKFRP